jgi:hypothetical protein
MAARQTTDVREVTRLDAAVEMTAHPEQLLLEDLALLIGGEAPPRHGF